MILFALLSLSTAPMTWSLATDDTVAKLAVVDNRPTIVELRGLDAKTPWGAGLSQPLIDRVWQKGREVAINWQAGAVKASPGSVTFVFSNANPPMEAHSVWRARPGRGPIEHWIEFVNKTSTPIAIPQQESLALSGLTPNGDAQVWWERRGASNALTEGGVFQNPVASGLNLNLVSDHHDPTSPVPWMAVQTGVDHGLYVGWEFSGLGRVAANSNSSDKLDIKVGLMPDFKTDIAPGETFTIPTAFVGCYKGDIDEGSQSLHRFVLNHLKAKTPKDFQDLPVILGLYLDAGADHATEADVLRCENFAKSMGCDVFMPDAMWFPACGDWRWDPARFPRGDAPIEQKVHADGMKFGLWCAWNNGGISTDPGALSVRGPYGHPDWFANDMPANWEPGPFYGTSADMGDDEAKAWAIKKTQQMAGDYKLDMLKTDVHPMINECSRTDHRHKYGTDVGYWSALGVYEVWDKLRAKFPGVVLENCSGASHIKDFGVIQRCAYTATTDTLSNLPDRAGIWDSTYILPPSALLTYTYEDGYGLPGDKPGPYLARSAMMTAWNLAPTDSKDWTPEMKASIIGCVHEYKEWVRPIQRDCVVHHILPRPDGKHWDGMFFWSPKLAKGNFFIFRPNSEEETQTVKLAGLDSKTRYSVWCEDGSLSPAEYTGDELTGHGLTMRLAGKYTSDIIHIQEAKLAKPAGWAMPTQAQMKAIDTTCDLFSTITHLSWKGGPEDRSYRLTISKNPDLSSPLVETVLYDPNYATKELSALTEFYIRVDALAWGGEAKGEVIQIRTLPKMNWDGVFVSDLPWVKGVAGVKEGPHRDINHYGNPLMIAGAKYAKGIWTHSFDNGDPADIVLDLTGKKYARFVSDVGLDDSSLGGSVQFVVIADGKTLATSPVLRPKTPYRINVDVTGVKSLTLRVLNGGDGYTSDHAVWGLARLLKPGGHDPFEAGPR